MIQPIGCNYPNKNCNYSKQRNIAKQVSFKAIKIQEISDKFRPMQSKIINETTKFADYSMGTKKLGQGLFSEVFQFLNLSNIVIKRSIRGGDDFLQETKALQSVPETLKGTQHFVARVYDDSKYEHYLLSTKVDGCDPEPFTNPWDGIHLRNLFSGMFEMDKVGLYHGDLNNGNIKLARNGDVNFLDFQWGTVTNKIRFFERNPVQCHPNFMLIQNAQMFEMAEVPYYLMKMNSTQDGKRFLKTYLQEKSKYHAARVNFIEKITANWPYQSELSAIRKGLDFEKAQAHTYKIPDDNVLRMETLKIQFLSSFREASKYLDPNTPYKNIITAPSSYLVALNNVQLLRREIARQQPLLPYGSRRNDYIKGMKEFADYWFDNLKSWTRDAFYYPYRHTQNELENWERLHNFEDPNVNIEYFEPMWDVISRVDKNYQPNYSSEFWIKTRANDALEKTVNKTPVLSGSLSSTNDVIDKFKNAQAKLKNAYNLNRGLDVINSSLLLTRRAYELSQKSLYSGSYSDYVKYQGVMRDAAKLAKNVFEKVYNEMQYTNSTSSLKGYAGMGDFY